MPNFSYAGDDCVVNLDHVLSVHVEGSQLQFDFIGCGIQVIECDSPEDAARALLEMFPRANPAAPRRSQRKTGFN
jgi:hypothetical protein